MYKLKWKNLPQEVRKNMGNSRLKSQRQTLKLTTKHAIHISTFYDLDNSSGVRIVHICSFTSF
jgi:hypothetical protein